MELFAFEVLWLYTELFASAGQNKCPFYCVVRRILIHFICKKTKAMTRNPRDPSKFGWELTDGPVSILLMTAYLTWR